ncbi:MAG TPA: hypothetical protein VIQ30_18110 [Pseudonocardia sp.]
MAQQIVARTGGVLVDLDDPAVRRLALADPGNSSGDAPNRW